MVEGLFFRRRHPCSRRWFLCCRKATYRAAGISHTEYISQIRRIYIAGCVAVGFCVAVRLLGASRVSLRLGRSAALTTHCVVIHYRLNRRALQGCRIYLRFRYPSAFSLRRRWRRSRRMRLFIFSPKAPSLSRSDDYILSKADFITGRRGRRPPQGSHKV